MTDLLSVAKSSARGSFFLFLGQFSSTIFMALASILVARILGPEEYGIYTIVFTIPSMLVTLSDLGISQALIRFSAYYHSKEEDKKVTILIKVGILFKLSLSLILSFSILLLAEGIAANVFKRPCIGPLLQIALLYLIGDAVLDSIIAVFIGLDKTETSSLLLNIQAITKAAVSPLLVILGLGVAGATLGVGLGFILAATIGILVLLLRTCPALVKNSRQSENINFFQGLKKMISYGMPLYISVLIGTILLQARTIILTLFASNSDIGNYAIAMNFTVLINILAYPITTSLFPAFSKLNIEKNRNEIGKIFKFAVKYCSLIIIPASIALTILSSDAVYTLYGSQYGTAPSYLSLYTLSFIYAGMGMFVIGPLINGQGYTKTSLKITIVGFAISITLASLLTPLYGVPGLITSILISNFISTSYGLYIVRQKFKLKIEPAYSLKILATSLLSALIVYIFSKLLNLTNPVYNLAFGGALFITSFLFFAPLIGAINEEDIGNLGYVLNESPVIRILANYILKIEKKILKLKLSLRRQQ